jgi:hypothetical protein
MRTLKFNNPIKITGTTINPIYLNSPKECYFERGSSVVTKYGIVVVSELNWRHNFGRHNFSVFATVLDGFTHSATLEEGKLSDRQIKWMATNFIKTVLSKDIKPK